MLLDITRLVVRDLKGYHPTGIDRVGLEYIRYYGKNSCALVFHFGRAFVLDKNSSEKLFSLVLQSRLTLLSYIFCFLRGNLTLPLRRPTDGEVLFNTGHTLLNDHRYERFVTKYRLKAIFMLHDIIPITHPEYCRPDEDLKHTRRVDAMLHMGSSLIFNSYDTCRTLKEYLKNKSGKIPHFTIASLAPAVLPPPHGRRPDDRPYFVMLGTIEPRKNHLLILNVWRDLVHDYGDSCPVLVIIGRYGWECEQVVDMLERCASIKPYVIHLNTCDDQSLSTWLSHAQALLMPSFAEGFGLPVVEALALGVPCIVSDLAVFHEFAGDAAVYIDPLDGVKWRSTIVAFTNNEDPMRYAMLSSVKSYLAPTWDSHFEQVNHLLDELPLR